MISRAKKYIDAIIEHQMPSGWICPCDEKDIPTYDTWAGSRWFEGFVALNFLYERYREDWILDLAKMIKEQGTDYDSLTELWKHPLCKWTYETHIVNIVMMLKHKAVSCDLLG